MTDEEKRDATSVEKPAETPPDHGEAYDPSMNVEDEANIPPDSAADSHSSDPESD